jgi:hypothetical protein
MRNLFPVYRRPTDEEFSEIWQECIFAFDANVLLDVYRYSSETRERFFEILRRFKDRIWIPHQAALEYHEHRLNIISEKFENFENLQNYLNDLSKELSYGHPFVEADELQILLSRIEAVQDILQEITGKHLNFLSNDPHWEVLAELFDGKIGEPFSIGKQEDIRREAEKRFKRKIPPGYKDGSKEGNKCFGDVILWFQLINYAKSQKKPIVLLTNDSKEDWWLKHKGKTIGPRPELIQEISLEAGVRFHMYSRDNFMKYAQEFLKLQDQKAATAVKEARELRKQDEIYQYFHSLQTPDYRIIEQDFIKALQTTELQRLSREKELQRLALESARESVGLQRALLPGIRDEYRKALQLAREWKEKNQTSSDKSSDRTSSSSDQQADNNPQEKDNDSQEKGP